MMALRSSRGSPPVGALVGVVGLLAARNVAGVALPGAAYVPTNAAVTAVLVALARHSGFSWVDLGMSGLHARRGITVGAVVASGAVVTMSVAAKLPITGGLFDDARVAAQADGRERLYQTAIRIPVGTVVFEEVAFRAVLLSVLRGSLSSRAAVVVDSALFGLWHIVPTLATARINAVNGPARLRLVAGSVAATAVGGVLLCSLLMRAGHVLAPAMVHFALNDSAYLLAWRLRRARQPRP